MVQAAVGLRDGEGVAQGSPDHPGSQMTPLSKAAIGGCRRGEARQGTG